MVQPKYSPKEALNKIKLMMSYDSSKTLTENKKTIKSVISEGEGDKDAAVRAILDKCSSKTVDLGKARMDIQDHIDMAALFDKAFSSAFGTDNKSWREALKKMSAEGVFEDLCAIAKQYEELADETFADGIDSDIDFDNEYTEFTTAFQKMIKRGTQQSLKVKDAQSSDISFFEKTFPCIFQSNANVNQNTDMDINKYVFIRIKSSSGKEYAVFSDGRVKTIGNPGGPPVKQTGKRVSCNGSRVSFINESFEKKKYLKEQFDDKDLEGGTGVPDLEQNKPNPDPKPVNPPINRYRDCGQGPFKKGCRTTREGYVGQVQACLGGLVQDGKFWEKTEAKLIEKTGRTEFTISDIPKICEKTNEVPEISGEAPPDVDGSNSDF
jgi:hypothetical protein